MSDPTDLRGYRRPYPGTQPDRIHLPYASTRLRGPGATRSRFRPRCPK